MISKMSNPKDFFIFILYPKENPQNNEITFENKKALIQCLFSDKNEKNEDKYIKLVIKYTYAKKVITKTKTQTKINSNKEKEKGKEKEKEKAKDKEKKKTKEKLLLEFNYNKNTYQIEFELRDNAFIFKPKITKVDKFLIKKKEIPQTQISNSEKFEIFYSALIKETGKEEDFSKFYKEAINLYGEEPTFEFLINIFVKIFNNLDLCKQLFEKFKNILKKGPQMNNDKISDNKNLQEIKDKYFSEIYEKAENEKLIKEDSNLKIDYYGLILCYDCNYNFTHFSELVNHIYAQDSETLFQILLIYKRYFKKDLKIDKEILGKFIEYTARNKTYKDLIDNGLIYLKNLKLFLEIVNKNREDLISMENFKPISTYGLEEKMMKNDIKDIIELAKKIISFSEGKKDDEDNEDNEENEDNEKKLLLIFNDKFWDNSISICDSSSNENIDSLSDLRELFERYLKLVTELYPKDTLSTEAKNYSKKNNFNIKLHEIIKIYIKNEKKSNVDILYLITKRDPIYFTDTNIDRRDCNILDQIDFEKIDGEFMNTYKESNFEIIFKKQIINFLTKLFDKAINWNIFCNIYSLVNYENIDKKKIKDLLNLINSTYDKLIKKKKELSELKENDKIIETLSDIAVFNNENKIDFFTKINGLDKELQNKIYLKLYSKYGGDKKYKDIIEKSIDFEINELKNDNLENDKLNKFCSFVNILTFDDYIDIMDRIKNKYLISEDDFYSSKKNKNICILIQLNKENLVNKYQNNYIDNSKPILESIYTYIKENKMKFTQLKSLFDSNEDYIIDKMNLFKLIDDNFDRKYFYDNYKKRYDEVSEKLKELKYISDNLKKYFSQDYNDDINYINKTISNIQNNLQSYEDIKTDLKLSSYSEKKEIADKVNKVGRMQLFNIIHRHTKGNNQKDHFQKSLNKLDNINDILKSNNNDTENTSILSEIKQNNAKIEEEINEYFKQKNADKELSLLVHYDSYKSDILSIFYFFDNLHNDEDWNKILIPEYRNISRDNIEDIIKKLKEKEIYDYEFEGKKENEQKSYYIQFFNYLYQKQQAMDFLNKQPDNLNLLYEKLDPNKGTIQAQDIDDAIQCVNFFCEIKKEEQKGNEFVFKYIKEKFKGNEKLIGNFKRFSYTYPSIIELNQSFDDFALNLYDEVNLILKKTDIILKQNNEEIKIYQVEKPVDKKDKMKINSINDIFTLKNKINVQPTKNVDNYSENEKILIKKNQALLLFKEIVNNIESIYEHLIVLRKKGNILPIYIKVSIETIENEKKEEETTVKYYLNDHKGKEILKSFDFIEKFLSKAKNDFIKQLELFLKNYEHLRFFYGKQYITIVNHLDGNRKVFPFLRYILNETDNKKEIKQGRIGNEHKFNDFIRDYKEYHKETFENIIKYVVSLFINNGSSIEEHYEKMKIKYETKDNEIAIINNENNENSFPEIRDSLNEISFSQKKENKRDTELKGIYIYKSKSESMEEDILQIFLDKIGRLPIAQNVLLTNKETSYEEMQVFLNRAILCGYNTLFVVEINKSFSESQQRYLNRFIDRLLAYRSKKNESAGKIDSKEQMDSCLVFICNEKTKSTLNYIKRTIMTYELKLNDYHNLEKSVMDNNVNLSKTDIFNSSRNILNRNVHVIKSDICGCGKTSKIKKDIQKENKNYIHFPVGGNITKNILFSKLRAILKKIEDSEENEKGNAAIHLDLYDNDEPSILNEFLFSFLITKFYSNNENILYIPIDIEIYVEIPNCFEDFLSKYTILNSFNIENIKLDKKPDLDLPEDKLLHFKNMLGLNNNDEISKYINNFFDISSHSYHQLTIFINLLIGQYSKTKDQRTFYVGSKNVTKEVIESFKNCTKYFTEGSFANLLTNPDKINKMKKNEEYKNILEDIYTNDIENQNYEYPLIFRNPKPSGPSYYSILSIKKDYIGLTDFDNENKDEKNKEKNYYGYKPDTSKYFLFLLKEILELDTSVERLKEIIDKDEYVITNDNFRKMVLIIYRIVANIPVILMGETGCGKTSLIRKLNQLLNDGKENLEFITIHPGITDEIIKEKILEINNKAKETKEMVWVFFDELNTCNSFALLTEIFINHSFEGEKLSENIRIIGACNPYRIRTKDNFICGLIDPNDIYDNKKDYVYLVNMLPQSLMYYIFNFGSINEEDEKKYIKSIISKNFHRKEDRIKYIENILSLYMAKNTKEGEKRDCLYFDNTEINIVNYMNNLIYKEYEHIKNNIDIYKSMDICNNKEEFLEQILNKKKQTLKDEKAKNYLKYLISDNYEKIKDKIETFKNLKKEDYIKYLIDNYDSKEQKEIKELLDSLINKDYDKKKYKENYKIEIYKDFKKYKNKENFLQFIISKNENADKYLKSLISKEYYKIEEILKDVTKDIISGCHIYLRKKLDPSCVSLREISRFSKCLFFFIEYYRNKNKYYKKMISENSNVSKYKDLVNYHNENINKIKSIIVSIYICYYLRLTQKSDREEFEKNDGLNLREKFYKLINLDKIKAQNDDINTNDLFSFIENQDFINDIKLNGINELKEFNQIIELEEDFVLDKIELDKGLGNNRSLKENVFLLFLSLGTTIPLIIIGKPGSGKSLSSHLIYKSMKGKYSTNKFFQFYPSIIQSYFQGSTSAKPEDVENIFRIAEGKLESFKRQNLEDLPVSMLLFDELG